jgi:AcrR family transcriptional regulator
MPSTASHQRRKDARPHELLEAAMALFAEKGYAATRTEEVAARAGVSKGTLYLYFASKEELLKAAIRHTLAADIAAGALTVAQHTGSAADLLVDVLAQWWERLLDSGSSAIFKVIITEVRNFPELADFYTREVIRPGHAVIERLLEKGIAQGEFRAVSIPDAVHSIVLPMIMLCVHKHSVGACTIHLEPLLASPANFIRQHLELLLTGLRRTDTPPTSNGALRAGRPTAPSSPHGKT